jgi:hypothetical protein
MPRFSQDYSAAVRRVKLLARADGYQLYRTRGYSGTSTKPAVLIVLILYYKYDFRASGKTAMWGTLARAGLDLLDGLNDAWSDGNATPHDRLSPLGEALAVTLTYTRPFL